MIKNYIKISIRNIVNRKRYSFINIFGLSIGMACCILILLYVQFEMSFDRYHENSGDIYRLATITQINNIERTYALSPGPSASVLKDDLPEILEYTRVINPLLLTQN